MKTANSRETRRGTAMVTVMVVVVSIGAMLATALSASLQNSFMTTKLSNKMRARTIAEAGANKAYEILTTNFDARASDAAFPQSDYSGGWFDVAVKTSAIDPYVAVICSTGWYAGALASVKLDARNMGPLGGVNFDKDTDGDGKSENAFSNAICTKGSLSWGGSGAFSNAGGSSGQVTIHSDQAWAIGGNGTLTNVDVESKVSISVGGSADLGGDVESPTNTCSGSGKITGTTTTNANVGGPVWNDVQDYMHDVLAAYKDLAGGNGMLYTGDLNLSSADPKYRTPTGGVLYVTGKLTIPSGVAVTGCFVSVGDLLMNGTQSKYSTYPALVSTLGAVDIRAQAVIHGLVYTDFGNVKYAGGGQLTGSILTMGAFEKTGISGVIAYEYSLPTAPGVAAPTTGATAGPDVIEPSAWHE